MTIKVWGFTAGLLCLAPLAAGASYSWEREPGPIGGIWKATCKGASGFTIELSLLADNKKAIGRVAELGSGEAPYRGYKLHEQILRLTADDHGDWVGELWWRGASGDARWTPIRFVASAQRLNATITLDDCYRDMPRVR